jgi:mutator protein MutT
MINRDEMVFRQSTVAYIHNDSKEFLVVQKESYQDDQWNFAGGGVDAGETALEAVKRELLEELGSSSFEVLGESKKKYTYDFPDEVVEKNYKKRGVWQRGQEITSFWVKFVGNKEELSPVDGIRRIKWVKREDLKNYLVFPNQLEIAEMGIGEFETK